MPDPPSKLAAFLSELKRRRVFRVAIVYAGVAFVIFQIIDSTFDLFDIPDWVGRFLVIALVLGLPIVISLAWAFDITEKGVVRTKGHPADAKRKAQPLIGNTALAIIAVVAVAFGIWGRWGTSGGDDLPIIAVLPFQNYSEDQNEWFADGFTDMMISQLAKLSDIGVIARTSTMHYKQTDLTASEVGRELGASVVLEGSVLRSGGKVRITGQLIDTRTDQHLWSENYERQLEDAIALQSDVAYAIAQALKDRLTPEEALDIVALPTASAAAYEHYLKALSLEQNLSLHPPTSRKDGIERRNGIIAELEAAIALDPAFAEAHYQLVLQHGSLYSNRSGLDGTPERLALLTQALVRAEAAAPNTSPVRAARGIYHFLSNREYRRALEYFEPLLAQAPNNPDIMARVGRTYRRLGRWDEGLELLVRAADLSPRDADLATAVLETYRVLHRYDEAERYFERLKFMGATERYETRGWMAVEARGDLEEAWAIFQEGVQELGLGPLDGAMLIVAVYRDDYDTAEEIVRNSPTLTRADSLWWMMWIYRAMGQGGRSQGAGRAYLSLMLNDRQSIKNYIHYRSLAQAAAGVGDSALATQWADTSVKMMNPTIDAVLGPINLSGAAWVYLITGDVERGLDLLEESQAHPNNHTLYDIQYIPFYDVVRDHPRFIALMERLKGAR